MPSDRGNRSGLAQDRALAPGLNRKVQDHLPGRKRVLARSAMGRPNSVLVRPGGNRRAKGAQEVARVKPTMKAFEVAPQALVAVMM